MKRFISLILAAMLLMSGCSSALSNINDPVEFYYLRAHDKTDRQKDYFAEGAFASEPREASGRRHDLYYLISMYLQGPLDANLRSPFPAGSAVIKVQQEGNTLSVYLNAAFAKLENMDMTLACGCLSQTCMALSDAEYIHIEVWGIDGKVLYETTVSDGSLLLSESLPHPTEESEETQSRRIP